MNFCNYYIIFAIICFISSVQMGEIITSPPITNWGDWGAFDKCPNGTFAQAFQLKTEPYRGALIDDTAVNAVKLYCGDPLNSSTPYVTSTEGKYGNWGEIYSCSLQAGYIHGFELRVEANGIVDDETATNNMRAYCNNAEVDQFLEADGLTFGAWRASRKCGRTQALCGIQTQVQKEQGLGDDTELNNISAECCDLPRHLLPA